MAKQLNATRAKLLEGDTLEGVRLVGTLTKSYINADDGEVKDMTIMRLETNDGRKYDMGGSAGFLGALQSAELISTEEGEIKILDNQTYFNVTRAKDGKNKKGQPLSNYDIFAI